MQSGDSRCWFRDPDPNQMLSQSVVLVQNTNAWEIQQQTDAIRKVYQRAVVIPMNNVEAIWRDYDAFENKQNKVTVSL